jgi:hypothetical protein
VLFLSAARFGHFQIDKGSYLDPAHFKRDVALIFSNSRAYNDGAAGAEMRILTDMLEVL